MKYVYYMHDMCNGVCRQAKCLHTTKLIPNIHMDSSEYTVSRKLNYRPIQVSSGVVFGDLQAGYKVQYVVKECISA